MVFVKSKYKDNIVTIVQYTAMQCQVKSNMSWDHCILIVFDYKNVFCVNGKKHKYI